MSKVAKLKSLFSAVKLSTEKKGNLNLTDDVLAQCEIETEHTETLLTNITVSNFLYNPRIVQLHRVMSLQRPF